MTYAYFMDVPQPIEMYEKIHTALMQRLGTDLPEGCFVHLATKTADGFRVTEVWESHEAVDRFGDEVMRPLIAELSGLSPEVLAEGPPPNHELSLLGLTMNPKAHVAV